MQLTEKHRPKRLSEVIGQSATVESLRLMIDRGLSSKAFYFLGASGTGKDSLAHALCGELAIDEMSIRFASGADTNAEFVRDLEEDFHNSSLFSTGDGWKAVIVSEAHAMSRPAVQLFLPFLERLPANRLVIFTSNAGLEAYAEFSGALFSRCAVFSLELDLEAAAVHASKVAQSENLDGQPLEVYRRLIADCGGNLRAALQRIESGAMLRATVKPADPAICAQSTPRRETPILAVQMASDEIIGAIERESERGLKFYAGSKKHKFHLERMTCLRSDLLTALKREGK